jgi:hypothetical protein
MRAVRGKGISHDRVLATIHDVNGRVPCGPGQAADEFVGRNQTAAGGMLLRLRIQAYDIDVARSSLIVLLAAS